MLFCMFQCRFSVKPCCGGEKPSILGGSSGEEYTCSVFDSGRCEPTNSFKNIKKHLELVEKLNDTNFEELRRQYFKDLQRVEEQRTTDELQSGPPCIRNHDYVSTLFPALVLTNRSTRPPIEPLSNVYVVVHTLATIDDADINCHIVE